MHASTPQSNVQMQHSSHKNAGTPLTRMDKAILTATRYEERCRIGKEILRGDKDGGITFPDFKIGSS